MHDDEKCYCKDTIKHLQVNFNLQKKIEFLWNFNIKRYSLNKKKGKREKVFD